MPPPQLFKYRAWRRSSQPSAEGTAPPVNYTESLLLNHALRCQKPRGFDDPHDSHTGAVATGSVHDIDRYALENMNEVIRAMRENRLTSLTQLPSSSAPETTDALRSLSGRVSRRERFIVSLSGVGDDEIMWTFYADEHRGICLEFDGHHPVFSAVQEVQYGPVPPPPAQASEEHDPLLFHKSLAWKFQAEWRALSPGNSFQFPPEALRRVILGYRFPEDEFERLAAVLIRGRYRVAIDQMQRPPNSYTLIPVRRGEIGPRATGVG